MSTAKQTGAAHVQHGYAIIQKTKDDANLTLGPGTLYAALSRLEERGMVRALPGEDRRRPYEITAEGAALLEARLGAHHLGPRTGRGARVADAALRGS